MEILYLIVIIIVGFAIFIMTVTNTEHAPAAGIALGLVINRWDYLTIIFIIVAIIWMASIKIVLKKISNGFNLTRCKPSTRTQKITDRKNIRWSQIMVRIPMWA